jgi:N-acetylmuramoyl-L-alanine amidase
MGRVIAADLPPRIDAGDSVRGAPIVAARSGPPQAPVRVLVTGSIHGNETAGRRVIARLRRTDAPAGVQVWTVRTLNPDGVKAGTRQNARGVDLNRNFPRRWRGGGRAFDTYFPGRAAGSEPETKALMRLVRRIRPAISVHYHQHMRLVNLGQGPDPAIVRRYARLVGLPARTLPNFHGTATGWQNHTFPGTSAFVVELPAGELSRAAVRRHATAILRIARGQRRAEAAAAAKPPIEWSPIPFGVQRRREMRAYSRRHYGEAVARLTNPKVIVEHFTATSTYGPAWNTFASDAPDPELHERPGTCAHFIVDSDGTIHQLVSLKWRCRHTVGLNHTAIGIEHVGLSDAEVMGRRRQLRASLRLTRWLQERFGIRTRDVIGHAESLSSPYHHERVKRLRTQTHGDFQPATMRRYRAKL